MLCYHAYYYYYDYDCDDDYYDCTTTIIVIVEDEHPSTDYSYFYTTDYSYYLHFVPRLPVRALTLLAAILSELALRALEQHAWWTDE